jgi:hypothetical protein
MSQSCGAAGQLRRLVWCVRGFQGGCKYQVGAVAEPSTSTPKRQGFETAIVPFTVPVSANFISQMQERWLMTARGRLGWT